MKLTSATFQMNGKTVHVTKLISTHITVTVFPENKTFNFSCEKLNEEGNKGVWTELLTCLLAIYGPSKRNDAVPNIVNSCIHDFGDYLQRLA